jgi:hypothetical protein
MKTAYLAEADLSAYKPKTIIDEDNKGYIGSVHQRKLTKEGLLVVDAEKRGKIYIIGGDAPTELSKIKMSNFLEVLNLSVENKSSNFYLVAEAAHENAQRHRQLLLVTVVHKQPKS